MPNHIETLELSGGLGLTSAQKLQVVSAIGVCWASAAEPGDEHFWRDVGLALFDDTSVCQLTALTGLKDLSVFGKIEAEGQRYMFELAGILKQLTRLRVCYDEAGEAAKEAFQSRMIQCNVHPVMSVHELTLRAVQ